MEIRTKGNILTLVSEKWKGYTFCALWNYHVTVKLVVLLKQIQKQQIRKFDNEIVRLNIKDYTKNSSYIIYR